MLTAIIADDNEAERTYFCKLLRETKKVKVLGEAADGLAALDLASQLRPDIAFLDIEMPGPNGLEVAREIMAIIPPISIIFFTAHAEYAVDAFEINSVDYLLKPFDAFRLRKALAKIEEKLALRQVNKRSQKLNKLALKSRGEIILIDLNEIVFIEKSGKNTTIVHTVKRDYTTSQTIGELVEQLERHDCFQRVHKSYLINLNMVERISPFADNSFVVRFAGYKKDALISRNNIELVKKHLNLI
ncbi:DNA-binding response regulator [Moorella sp. E308F]|uniref:LytR/AlgR family response regulator transcription factor n=1 Tax=Moorella sp. E308F TaxID=2572682 RepID=UPI0010FFB9EF|nr:LytTR family DNA-binding domain-containing protein [Moorella sp. E308F]GEA16540.1 DNA-binding response regulator [Moorella sp. E308F]